MKASEWIDRLKKTKGWESDYRAAKELGVGRATVSKYRTASSTLDDDVAVKVAEALGEAPEIILLDQAVERTRSDEARAALSSALEHVRGKLSGARPALRVAAGGKGRIDISSVTPISAPEWNSGPRIEPEYTSSQVANAWLQILANRAAAAQSSYSSSFAHN